MIVLITGLPGAGKSLYALQYVKDQAERESRPVCYSGIKDLRLPWAEIDGADWHKQAAGSIVVVDEAQRVFRPRGVGSAVPEHVAKLETHRHQGLDLVLITQHPKLLDANVRRLVGRHFHVVRNFGMERSTVHEWGELNEDCDSGGSRKDSIRHEWGYPKELFAAYTSAEVHTHKRRIPARVWFLVAAPVLVVGLGWVAYSSLKNATKPPVVQADGSAPGQKAGAVVGSGRPVLTVAEWLAARAPRIAGLPQTAAVFDGVTNPVRAPYPAMCIAAPKRCQCYTDQGTRIDVPEGMCRSFAGGGFYVEWDQKPSTVAQDRSGQGQGSRSGFARPDERGASAAAELRPVALPVSELPPSPAERPLGVDSAEAVSGVSPRVRQPGTVFTGGASAPTPPQAAGRN